ncbi:hypothetical protein [Geomobilimonas luticola]|uniref:Uncharacterized protein n=1 Tax=Geomobilimonas luticola TaxID=1114878 RepID=A0ABS5S9I7_9BACT|nr:hypothetical protein [Geomobilimonas luticola]MBT0652039.1 hypothetical protein [Geomobilimonas luticola]
MAGNSFNPFIITGENTSIIEDIYLLAALITFDPRITYSLRYDKVSGRVAYEVHGRVSEPMRRYYAGEVASLKTFIGHVKALRSAAFALKNSVKGEGAKNIVNVDIR